MSPRSALALLLLAGCGEAAAVAPGDAGPDREAVVSEPLVRLPRDEGPFYPSQLRLAEEHADIVLLADVARCTGCHADAAAQHQASAHARSSFDNPWYRAVVDRVREDAGLTASRHCAGCHDPLLLISGRMDREIDPADPETNRLARAGITCLVCHGVTETRSDGNASFTLSTAPVVLPDPNDAEAVAAHRARVAPSVLRTPGLCGSCHRGFLGTHSGGAHFLPGIDEIGPWRGSAFGGQDAQRIDDVPEQECRGCHMPETRVSGRELGAPEGWLASHRFPGGHSAIAGRIAAEAGDRAQLEAIAARQASAATLDVAALWHADGSSFLVEEAELRSGEDVAVDLVIRNTSTGHRFPGGARDLRDTFLEVVVRDARGAVIAEAGTEHERGEEPVRTPGAPLPDPTAFVLATWISDENGAPDREHLVHRFRALLWDHTIAPRDALAVRYGFRVPERAALPLTVSARLRSRRHHAGVRAFGCQASQSERGRAFDRGVREAGGVVLDGCADEPILEVASAQATIGSRAAGARPTWERLYEHGLALSHEVQERLDDARPSLERALERIELEMASGTQRERARAEILRVLAELDARQGRLDEALARSDRVESMIGAHPAIDRVRGRAFAQVWRWRDAAGAFGRVAAAAPLDTDAHRDHSRALGSLATEPRMALAAANRGLALLPRDESLLRTQMLALEDLSDPRSEAARAAFLRYRRPDDETELRLRCDSAIETCARDRLPVVTIAMRPIQIE